MKSRLATILMMLGLGLSFTSFSSSATIAALGKIGLTSFAVTAETRVPVEPDDSGSQIPLTNSSKRGFFQSEAVPNTSILVAGYPVSSPVACDANEPSGLIEETVNAGSSSLSYHATADQYSYVWKTARAWKGTCRILVVRLNDGSDHLAKFRFR